MDPSKLENSINISKIIDFDRFRAVITCIDSINESDPNQWEYKGSVYPREWIFGIYHYNQIIELNPDADELLLIAARGQHIARWKSSRKDYPEGRAGYLKWRADLKKFHADTCANILKDHGYTLKQIDIVRDLNLKKDIKTNPDCQTLEDALCLVFLKHQYAKIAEKYPSEKVVDILQKTAKKMSSQGLKHAKQIEYDSKCSHLLHAALGA